MIRLRVLGWGVSLDEPSGPNIITRVLRRERLESPKEKVAV